MVNRLEYRRDGEAKVIRPTLRGLLPWLLLPVIILATLTGCSTLQAGVPGPLAVEERHIIVLWHDFTGVAAEALQMLTDRFNEENTWGTVLITEYQQDLMTKLQGAPENQPDLITVWPKDLQSYVALGLVGAPPLESPDLQDAQTDLLPMAPALYRADGTPQALPLGLSTYILYLNEEWLSDLAYDPETADLGLLRQISCAANDPERGRTGLGMPARASTLLAALTAGGARITGDDGYYQFSDDAGRVTASILKELLSGECGIVYEDWDVGLERFSKSSMAMMMESSDRLAEIEHAILLGRNFSLGVSAPPGTTGPGPTLWYGPGLMITAPEGERRSDALNVMGWFFSVEAQTYWGEATPYIPIRRSVIEAATAEAETAGLQTPRDQLWTLALTAAEQGTWVTWPQPTNRITCRASLLRGLLALESVETDTDAYIDTAVTACNTGVSVRIDPTPAPATDEETP